jgi:hypothetical protein
VRTIHQAGSRFGEFQSSVASTLAIRYAERGKVHASGAGMSYDQSGQDVPERDGGARASTPEQATEIKRLAARRRFLRSGGAALSALVTMSPGRLGAVTWSECARRFPQFSALIIDVAHNRGQAGSDQAGFLCQVFGNAQAEE